MAQGSFKAMLIVVATILVALTIKHQVEKSWRSAAEEEMALARCDGPGESDCGARVEARHARCFESNDEVGQTRVSAGHFDDRGYLRCIAEGSPDE